MLPSTLVPTPKRRKRKMVIRQPLPAVWRMGLGIASMVLCLLAYEALAFRQYQLNPKQTLVPSITKILGGFREITTPDRHGNVWLWEDFKASSVRMGVGLLIGVVFSTIVGVLMGCFSFIEACLKPFFSILSKIPQPALLPLLFVTSMSDFWLFISLISIGIIMGLAPAIYQMTKYDVPQELIDKGYTLGASTAEQMWNVIFPVILPRIIEALRLQVFMAAIFLIAAEIGLADVGFGYRMKMRMRVFDSSVILDYVIVLIIIGYVIDDVLTTIRQVVSPWFDDNSKPSFILRVFGGMRWAVRSLKGGAR